MKASEVLAPTGPLAALMPGYEQRAGQLEMATAVERALDEDRVLLCEAGTGTGKTLAYLVPALQSGRRVVVSTASKALQEQIFDKDLPLLRQVLAQDINALVIKGLSNYLCLRRFEEFSADPDLGAPMRRALPLLEQLRQSSSTGDIAEVNLDENHPAFARVSSSSDTRLAKRCNHYDACFVTRLKKKAQQAQLLIVNHHLLCADLAVRGDHPGSVLPDYEALIVDEAHKLEDTATQMFGIHLSDRSVLSLSKEVERLATMLKLPPAVLGLLRHSRELAHTVFAKLNANAATRSAESRQPLETHSGNAAVRDAYHDWDSALAELLCLIAPYVDKYGGGLTVAAKRIDALRQRLATVMMPDGSTVTWLERTGHSIKLAAMPVHVGQSLQEKIFDRGSPVILTSASMSSNANFGFMRERLGIKDEQLSGPVDELIVPSSINYLTQSLLYLPSDLPDVSQPGFAEAAAQRIRQLIEQTPGGALILCTSHRNASLFAQAMKDRRPLVQGDAPKRTLLDNFRSGKSDLLIATASFWEGVDVPGAALRLVVIDRLPFDVPSDPLVQARCKLIEQNGKRPFFDYSVPRAAIALKQGFGRLLRNRHDVGVVAILDRRIVTRSYGRTLLNSLPQSRQTRDLEDVEAFWRQQGSEDGAQARVAAESDWVSTPNSSDD